MQNPLIGGTPTRISPEGDGGGGEDGGGGGEDGDGGGGGGTGDDPHTFKLSIYATPVPELEGKTEIAIL